MLIEHQTSNSQLLPHHTLLIIILPRQDALDIAVAEERASLVTVLRFIRINEASDPTSKSWEKCDQ